MGKRKDFGCTPAKAIREVASLKLNPEETPQTPVAYRGDLTDRQELGLKNFTQLI
jgi:hypothetical protein